MSSSSLRMLYSLILLALRDFGYSGGMEGSPTNRHEAATFPKVENLIM